MVLVGSLNRKFLAVVLCMVMFMFLLLGCAMTTESVSIMPTPASGSTTQAESPLAVPSASPNQQPADDLDVHRNFTASQSFPAALAAAKAWNPESQWYGLFPFTSMVRFLAIPILGDTLSWHFRFASPDGDEYLVEVRNGEVIAENEANLPAYIEPSLDTLVPLGDVWVGMDSGELLDLYAEQPDNLLDRYPGVMFAYRLVHVKGESDPLWTLFDSERLEPPLFIVNAVTGEILSTE